MNQNLKIVELKAENIKKLVAVSIRPDGNVVELTGKNGQGKTSVLDAISWALEGAALIQGEPIRKGQTKAWVSLDLGDIIVKRSFKKSETGETTSSITVESKDGARFGSPQAMLDALLGRLAFDPLAFARMKPREQFDELKRLVPGVDFDALEKASKADFDRRTALSRKAKEARAAQNAIEVTEQGETARIDTEAIMTELTKASEGNVEIEKRKSRRDAVAVEIKTIGEECDRLHDALSNITVNAVTEAQKVEAEAAAEAKIIFDKVIAAGKEKAAGLILAAQKEAELMTNRLADQRNRLDEQRKKLAEAPPLPEPTDIGALREKLASTMKKNDEIKMRVERINKRDEADRLEAEASGMTEAIDAREKTKRAAIEAAKLPVAGLTFGDGAILMNGVPFDQASDAEQLRASIAIAMSLNPKLRVIRVRDGSLLDEGSMKLLAEMAKDQDYQVWIERVDGSGKVGFVLEDGHIKPALAAV